MRPDSTARIDEAYRATAERTATRRTARMWSVGHTPAVSFRMDTWTACNCAAVVRSGRKMIRCGFSLRGVGRLLLAFAVTASAPAWAAEHARAAAKQSESPRPLGSFTPSLIDAPAVGLKPGSAAAHSFRFTPSGKAGEKHAVTLATHARLASPTVDSARADAPSGYDIGMALGTRGLALSGAVKRTDSGLVQRDAVSLGLGYGVRDWTTTLKVGEETNLVRGAAALDPERRYSVELGGAYALGRDVKLGAGVRYRVVPGDSDAALKSVNDRAAFLGLGVAF